MIDPNECDPVTVAYKRGQQDALGGTHALLERIAIALETLAAACETGAMGQVTMTREPVKVTVGMLLAQLAANTQPQQQVLPLGDLRVKR